MASSCTAVGSSAFSLPFLLPPCRRSSTTRKRRTWTCRTCSGSRCRCSTTSRRLAWPDLGYVCLGITAALATCTKDQAFGFYVLPAAHLVWLRLRAGQGATLLQRLSTVFTDRPLRLAAIASMVTFALAHNLLFNIAGFTEHVRIITGPASVPYQVFERTLEGHLQMLWEALRQVLWSFGWPGLALCVAGLVRSLRPGHRASLFVLLPAVSYYAFFISIVMFHYSRFLLGICAILAIFGGRLAADMLEHGRAIWWRRGALAAILTYSVFNGPT